MKQAATPGRRLSSLDFFKCYPSSRHQLNVAVLVARFQAPVPVTAPWLPSSFEAE
jgi:hypothetical protein